MAVNKGTTMAEHLRVMTTWMVSNTYSHPRTPGPLALWSLQFELCLSTFQKGRLRPKYRHTCLLLAQSEDWRWKGQTALGDRAALRCYLPVSKSELLRPIVLLRPIFHGV